MRQAFKSRRHEAPSEKRGGLKTFFVLLVWIGIACAGYLLYRGIFGGGDDADNDSVPENRPPASSPADAIGSPKDAVGRETVNSAVEIGIALGTEKERWFTAAINDFNGTPEGKQIKIHLLPLGSIESANEIIRGNQGIHVWCPASSMYRDVFEQKWRVRHSGDPIAKSQRVAISPAVFVIWRDRYEALLAKYQELSFDTLRQALTAEGGWGGIAAQPEWGLVKFGHTHPQKSNSGLVTLVLMAYEFHGKSQNLSVADVVDPDFQSWSAELARGGSGLTSSTGTMMNDMVLMGPSTYDVTMAYESAVIDYLESAAGRWGEISVVYPEYNIWNDNPYYILNAQWVTQEHRGAAERFLKFLMEESQQKKALEHGFRPGDPTVPVKLPESPFVKYKKYGLRIDLNLVCEPPSGQVIINLQQTWQRAAGSR